MWECGRRSSIHEHTVCSLPLVLVVANLLMTGMPLRHSSNPAANSRSLAAAESSSLYQLKHNYSLPWSLLQSAQGSVAPTARLRKLHRVLQSGTGTLRMAVVGGSFSTTRRAVKPWVGRVEDALRASFPHLNLTLHNGARGGADIAYAAACLDAVVPGTQPWDLVFVEFNPNMMWTDFHPKHGTVGLRNAGVLEGLFRRLLLLPGHPLIVVMQSLMPMVYLNKAPIHYYDHSEEVISLVASYHNVPMLSVRNALWHLQRAKVPGFSDDDTRQPDDRWHLNDLGARYAADVALYFLGSVMPNIFREESGQSPVFPQQDPHIAHELSDATVFPTMLAKVPTVTSFCATMEGLKEHVHADGVWTYGQLDDKHDKTGMFTPSTSASGARLNFTWKSPPAASPTDAHELRPNATPSLGASDAAPTHLLVSFHFYRSSQSIWASARLACLLGCTCQALEFTAVWARSQTSGSAETVDVTPVRGATCVVQLTVLPGPLGGTKFFLISVSVAEAQR